VKEKCYNDQLAEVPNSYMTIMHLDIQYHEISQINGIFTPGWGNSTLCWKSEGNGKANLTECKWG